MSRGQVPLPMIVVGAIGTIIVPPVVAFFTANASVKEEVASVRQEVAIVKTTEELHYKELSEDVIELKLDVKEILKLLKNQ